MRQAISIADLSLLVEQDVEIKVNGNVVFTAYDVTTALRAVHPDLDIHNDDVRALVHRVMDKVVGVGIYDRQLQDYNGNQAWTYFSTQFPQTGAPVAAVTSGVPPIQIPAVVPRLSWLPDQIPDND